MLKAYLDIEVRPSTLDIERAENPVVCASVMLPSRKIYTLILGKASFGSVAVGGKEFRVKCICFNREKDLLNSLYKIISGVDFLIGWNIIDYDMPYLYNRGKKIGADVSLMSPIGRVYRNRSGSVVVDGVNIIDALTVYAKVKGRILFTSLQRAAIEELGVGKLYSKDKLDELPIVELAKYNAVDVALTYLIDRKLRLSDFAIELARESYMPVGGPTHDAPIPFASSMVDNTLLHYARRIGIALPCKVDPPKKGYEGAIVFEPVTGIHDDVLVLDFSRLYPNIIINFNISPETVSFKPFNTDKQLVVYVVDRKLDAKFKAYIRYDIDGLVPKYLLELFKLRDKYESMRDKYSPESQMYKVLDNKQYVIKQIINAVYGQFSYRSRICNLYIAALITCLERKIIKLTKSIAERMGYKVLFGDTDSVFIKLSGQKNYEEIGEELSQKINDYLSRFYGKEFHFKLKAEEHFKRLLLFRKKRYAGLVDWVKGKVVDPPELKVKGFEIIRTDTPVLAKDVLKDFISLLLEKGNDMIAIANWLMEIRDKFMCAEPELIAVPVTIHKTEYKVNNIQAKAIAFIRRTFGIKLKPGAKVFWAYDKGGGIIAAPEDMLDALNKFRDRIDYKRMFQRNVEDKIKDLLKELLGIRVVAKQSTLF